MQSGTSAVLLACQFGHRELLEILIDRYHCAATDKDKACGCIAHNAHNYVWILSCIKSCLAALMLHLHSYVRTVVMYKLYMLLKYHCINNYYASIIRYHYVYAFAIVILLYGIVLFCICLLCGMRVEWEDYTVVCSCQWPSAHSETPGWHVWLQPQCGGEQWCTYVAQWRGSCALLSVLYIMVTILCCIL